MNGATMPAADTDLLRSGVVYVEAVHRHFSAATGPADCAGMPFAEVHPAANPDPAGHASCEQILMNAVNA